MSYHAFPTSSLQGQLTFQRHTEPDVTVEMEADGHGCLGAGRIMDVQRSRGRQTCCWTVTGLAVPASSIALSGEADGIEAAKEAFRAAWDRLLAWYVGSQRVDGLV